jgi:tyrosyl-tRNA synthetase
MDKTEELLTRGVANIIPDKDKLKKLLSSGKKLNIYLGIDPTATRIHLGHAVVLRKLNEFAKLGHNVSFLIGDFTALIGDTSDKDTERPVLTPQEVQENFKTYKKQAEKILDFSKIQIKYNSEWLSKLNFKDVLGLTMLFSAGDFISRELIRKRLDKGERVGLHEFLYPLMQGYDSYHMDTDIQIGGTDQTFNMQAGRTLQKLFRKKESFIISTEFLMGTDGRKMSKSWGNAVWLDDSPNDMYAKVMAISDAQIIEYIALATNWPLKEKDLEFEYRLKTNENPINIKKDLAFEIVKELYNEKDALAAKGNFENIVQKKNIPEEIREVNLSIFDIKNMNIVDLLTNPLYKLGLAKSKSDAKRLIEQEGVKVNSEIVKNPDLSIELKDKMIISVGKHKFVKIVSK